jgi:OOP family OmpA-OmpF porin
MSATPRDQTLGVLDGLTGSWSDAAFSARVADGNGGAYRVGDPIHFELGAEQELHAILFYLDSYGVATLFRIQGSGTDGAIAAGESLSVPTEADGFSLEVVPPVGNETLYFVATREPLAAETIDMKPGQRITAPIDPDAGPELARRFRDAVEAQGADAVAIVRLQQRIVAGSDTLEYTTREIVDHFRSTRALRRPRLPMHLAFDFDSAELTPQIRENLDEMGRAMQHQTLAGQKFVIGGHTDDRGDDGYNLELSRQRAQAVAEYLEQNYGLGADQIEVKAYGETAPIEQNADDAARAQNRRVEFELAR